MKKISSIVISFLIIFSLGTGFCLISYGSSGAEEDLDEVGWSMDVPTWKRGSTWEYDQRVWANGTDEDGDPVELFFDESLSHTVSSIEYVDIEGVMTPVYNITVEGVVEGGGIDAGGTQLDIDGGSFEGYTLHRLDDLSTVVGFQDKEFYSGVFDGEIRNKNTEKPPVEAYDFPLTPERDFWANNTIHSQGETFIDPRGGQDPIHETVDEKYDMARHVTVSENTFTFDVGGETFEAYRVMEDKLETLESGEPADDHGHMISYYNGEVQNYIEQHAVREERADWIRKLEAYDVPENHNSLSVEPSEAVVGETVEIHGSFPDYASRDFDVMIPMAGFSEPVETDGAGDFMLEAEVPYVEDNTPSPGVLGSVGIVAMEASEDTYQVATLIVLEDDNGDDPEGPKSPIDPLPEDGATGLGTDVELSVFAEHHEGESMDVSFYDASDSLIGSEEDVGSGQRASITWSDLEEDKTYEWYAVADDGEYTAESSRWSFTTLSKGDPYFSMEIIGYEEEVEPGEELLVDYKVTNIGEMEDEQPIEFKVDGTVKDSVEVTLGPEEIYEDEFLWNAGEEGTYSISVASQDDEDEVTVSVVKKIVHYELTINAEEGGTTDPEPGTYSYEEGEEVTIEAVPEEDWLFVGWSGDIEREETEITIFMDEDKEVNAHFEEDIDYYELLVFFEGQGEVNIDPDEEEYAEGSEVDLTAVPEEGWLFVGWVGDYESTEEEITITMDEDKEVTVRFAREPFFEVEIITPQDGDEFEEGEEVVLMYRVRNTGGISDEQDIELYIRGEAVGIKTIYLEARESHIGEFVWEADEDGEIGFEIRSSDDGETDSISLTISAVEEPPDGPDGPGENDNGDEELNPQWLILAALIIIGVILAVLVVTRGKKKEKKDIPSEFPPPPPDGSSKRDIPSEFPPPPPGGSSKKDIPSEFPPPPPD